jgi:hypothetical protein
MLAAAIDWPDRMNDVFRGQVAARSNDRVPGRQRSDFAHDLSALRKDGRAARAMNRSVDSPAAQKGGVGGIHNCVGGLCGDVGRAVNVNRSAAIEHQSDCEGLHARVQNGQFVSVTS